MQGNFRVSVVPIKGLFETSQGDVSADICRSRHEALSQCHSNGHNSAYQEEDDFVIFIPLGDVLNATRHMKTLAGKLKAGFCHINVVKR